MKKVNNYCLRFFALMLSIIMVTGLMPSTALAVGSQTASSSPSFDYDYQVATTTDLSMLLNYTGELSLEELETAELPADDIPEVFSDALVSQNNHVNRLRLLEQDLNTVIFQNRDGTNSVYLFSTPVKYVDDNGNVKDKSNSLTNVISDSRFDSDYAFVNENNDINTYFPTTLRSDKGVKLVSSDLLIELSPLAVNSNFTEPVSTNTNISDRPANVSEAQLAFVSDRSTNRTKDAVIYKDVFGINTSLRYTATFDGFKEDIILYKYDGKNRFSFKLMTNGLRLIQDDYGNLYLLNPSTGEYAASIGQIMVMDSGNCADCPDTSGNHYYEIETVKDDEIYIITAVVDTGFLTDKSTVYPVYIDPEISAITNGTKNIIDAPIYEYVNHSQGSNYWNIIGMEPTDYGVGRTLMRFPGLANNSAYMNSNNEILSLKLYLYNSSTNTNTVTISARQYTGTANWSETGVWASNIAWDGVGTTYSSVSVSTNNKWYAFDLTNAPWKTNSSSRNQGIMLINSNETSSSRNKTFSSTERSSEKPYISFTYRRKDLKNATTILNYSATQLTNLSQFTWNCFGNGIGKQVLTSPTGYAGGQSTEEVYAAVVNDLGGPNNVRRLSSIDSSINSDEFKVAVKCGPSDYHFIRQLSNGTWYNKSGTTVGLVISQDLVESSVWYARYMRNGVPTVDYSVYYDDTTIYFAVKKNWYS